MGLGLLAAVAATGSATAGVSSSSHMTTAQSSSHVTSEQKSDVHPLITGDECSSSTAHWFTLHIFWDGGSWEYWCFGDKGSLTEPDNNQFVWACSGNNSGTLGYYGASGGSEHYINFGPGWSENFPQGTLFAYLSITGWSGSYNC
jgi:hypothetical protein